MAALPDYAVAKSPSAEEAMVAQESLPLLSVSRLSMAFGPVRALDGIDLSIMPGEVVALAGENGAGKTTLLRAIGGDIKPTGGEIMFRGRALPADPGVVARRGVGVVWQDLSLCDNLDIASNLLLGRERRRQLFSNVKMHSDASALIAELGVPLPDTTRSVSSLSGGQRQLVAIARAMVNRPALLLLDEPTASLSIRYAAQFEELIASLRQKTTVVIACHDLDLMFRLATRIVVLKHGKIVAEVDPAVVYPDDVTALLSGQEPDSSPRRQLNRLHGLTGRLVAEDPSSSLSLILSALGAALGSERLCIHLAAGRELACEASLGLPDALLDRWARLPIGSSGGPAGLAAATERPVIAENAQADWGPFKGLAAATGVASSWSVPVLARDGLAGVITGFGDTPGQPERGQLELVTVYAGYVASAIERDRLLDEVTERNRVLETIREVLETLAGPVPVSEGIPLALQSLCRGLQADEVALLTWQEGSEPRCRGSASIDGPGDAAAAESRGAALISSMAAEEMARHGTAQWIPADGIPADGRPADGRPADGRPADGRPADGRPADGRPADGRPADGRPADGRPADGRPADGIPADGIPADGIPADGRPADGIPADGRPADGRPADGIPADGRPADGRPADGRPADDGQRHLAVTFTAPGGPSVLVASWRSGPPTTEATVLVEDAAHSLRLALEREQARLAQQEATALRRSQELQREFLSRLSHELRTPLTAIRGYASSLLQPDVTWDAESQQRFLTRIAAESARLGRLVDDMLDFSAIELGILRLQPDWCDIMLVLEAAVACLPPDGRRMVRIGCAADLPVIWADHDRLEQVFVNLLANAIGHNPPGTPVTVLAQSAHRAQIFITVADEGVGLPSDVAAAPFEPRRPRSSKTGGAGLGLSITRGIVTAHGGRLELMPSDVGASFAVTLPIEDAVASLVGGDGRADGGPAGGADSGQWLRKEAVGRGRARG